RPAQSVAGRPEWRIRCRCRAGRTRLAAQRPRQPELWFQQFGILAATAAAEPDQPARLGTVDSLLAAGFNRSLAVSAAGYWHKPVPLSAKRRSAAVQQQPRH